MFAPLGQLPEVADEQLESYAVISAMGPTYFWFQFHALEQLAAASSLEDYLAMPADPRVVMPRLFDEGGVLGLRVDL